MLRHLEVVDLRCIRFAELELDPRCTIITGANGSGKSSLLEAIHVLGYGRSFRTSKLERLVRLGANELRVVGHVGIGARDQTLGVRVELANRGRGCRVEGRLAGTPVRGFADLALALPIEVIDPSVHGLIEDGPERRRRFLDRGLFHVEPQYLEVWRRYQRALKQRNTALANMEAGEAVHAWDNELLSQGARLTEWRQNYVQSISHVFREYAASLAGLVVQMSLQPGWKENSFEDALNHAWQRDSQAGYTTVGPHRADLAIEIENQPVQHHVSRGQQKMLACGLVLSQVKQLQGALSDGPCLLIDDPAAELDVDKLATFLGQVAAMPSQLVITSLDGAQLFDRFAGCAFHVEQGEVTRLV